MLLCLVAFGGVELLAVNKNAYNAAEKNSSVSIICSFYQYNGN